MPETIPYTHYAYFDDRGAAESCGKELDLRFDCLAAIDPAITMPGRWKLRAAHTVNVNIPWHAEIEEVVERHGGTYDFGEACMFVRPSQPDR